MCVCALNDLLSLRTKCLFKLFFFFFKTSFLLSGELVQLFHSNFCLHICRPVSTHALYLLSTNIVV